MTGLYEISRDCCCFDFDYPDQSRLRAMQGVKRHHPGIPVLMLTVEHSEALAVWAFRARVWNFLAKPIATEELRENMQTLVQLAAAERRHGRVMNLPEASVPQQIPARRPDLLHMALMPALYFIQRHFNQRFSAEEVAKLCGMSRFHFSRAFRHTFGVTFQNYLLHYRVTEACNLLRRPEVSVTDVGYAVGFNDPSHFARIFKRYTGTLPSDYVESDDKTEIMTALSTYAAA